jgi:carboxylesterase type B
MERSPKFAENILGRYGGRAEDVQEEILRFGCPYCGHPTFDHRWAPPLPCLEPGCDCTDGEKACEQESEADTRAAIYEVLTA